MKREWRRRWLAAAMVLTACCGALGGCAWGRKTPQDPFAQRDSEAPRYDVHPAAHTEGAADPNADKTSAVLSSEIRPPEPEGWDKLAPENVTKSIKKALGQGPDIKIARAAYDEGMQLYQAGTELVKQQQQAAAEAKFVESQAKFAVAEDRWPDSSLEEDALFMQAEAYFFTDQYVKAEDKYQALLVKYANSRYLDKTVQRQFAIARFWQESAQANPSSEYYANLTDKTRPTFDTYGNAIRVYENIRLNDPRGMLADDAVMAAANAHFTNGKFDDSDHLYGVLRTDYPKSEHQLNAHLLGLQSKLKLYQGADYDIKPLAEADKLVDLMLINFPQELGTERENMLKVKAEAKAQQALRDWNLAQKYEEGDYFRAARFYYQKLLKDFPDTPFAEKARERLASIADKPDNPPDRFTFLNSIFGEPSGKAGTRPK